jgi:hypothetical protein
MFIKTIFCIILLIIIAPYASAQEVTDTNNQPQQSLNYNAVVNNSDIDTDVTPEFPGAFQKVTIRMDSDTINLNRYVVTWQVDGVTVQEGLGLRTLQITSGDYGTTQRIQIIVNLGLSSLRKDVFISPQDATLLWEAVDSYVPPFYRGKKFPAQESLVKISAIPNFQGAGNSLALNDAIFLWNRNGNKILNVGGYGKDSITIKHNRLRKDESITAEISNVNGGSSAKKTVLIPFINPEIHWYTKNLSNYRRLSSVDRGIRVKSGDTKIIAEPYFFSVRQKPAELDMSWTMGGETIYLDPDSSKQEILVRNPNQEGQASFGVTIKNPKTFLQGVGKTVSIFFEKPAE